ncbi:DUF2334 domain-containing protein [Umezawaea beigongshangensis]|uniref:DUF2334 domain-containing protein n=1 Tax=Umezawaea beigongshangensis TaxID=2780383 RepID=UPI0018F24CF6|nr:DUF2334 domain-containing protein [Umezawaea beigongshangensis]
MSSQLVVSLSGVGAGTLDRCADLAAELDRRNVPLSLVVAPRAVGPVHDWVKQRTAAGDALVLRCDGGVEFAHEANLRLIAARNVLERLGLVADCYAPPRRASAGTLTALRRHRFALCADAVAVRDLRTGRTEPARVHGLRRVGGERGEPWRCRALVLGAARVARRGGLVRLAVDASDLDRLGPRQAVLDAVDIALHHGAAPTTYQSQTRVGSPGVSGATTVPFGARRSNSE